MQIVGKDSEFTKLIALFEEDAGQKLEVSKVDFHRLFLSGRTDEGENEIMLRLNTSTKQLVVARICFIHRRKGFGQRLLSLLMEYGKEQGYQKIVFESVLTDGLKQFLTKHGFCLASPEPFELNWIKEI